MSMNANIIVHGMGGSSFLNRARGIGAAELVLRTREEVFERIIFSGGKTYGHDAPSEAAGMYMAFQERIKDPKLKVHLEETACDTHMNATESLKILGEDIHDSVLFLLSSGWHLPRIDRIYRELGAPYRVLLDTDTLVAPDIEKSIKTHPVYRIGKLREPLAQLFEYKSLQFIKRSLTSRRIEK